MKEKYILESVKPQ